MEGRLHMLRQQQHSNATQQPQQRSATAAAQQCNTAAAAAVAAHCNTTPWTSLAGSVQSCLSPARVTGSVGTPITTSQSSTFTLAALSSTSTDSSGVKALKRVYVTGPPERLQQAYPLAVHLMGGTVPASVALPAGFAPQFAQAAPPAPAPLATAQQQQWPQWPAPAPAWPWPAQCPFWYTPGTPFWCTLKKMAQDNAWGPSIPPPACIGAPRV